MLMSIDDIEAPDNPAILSSDAKPPPRRLKKIELKTGVHHQKGR